MSITLSQNTQAILLLTAPLIAGQREHSAEPLTLGEYKRLARVLRERQVQPADLLSPDAGGLLREYQGLFCDGRLARLLGRGFLLSQVVEHWQARAIWVISRADPSYPRRFKTKLGEDAPPVLYGCGDTAILDTGGLAVVGSRHVDDTLIEYAQGIGRLAATARCNLISGGARGIDQAAMRGALEGGGKVIGVLSDSLERAALLREHREALMDGRLALISPYDPAAGFNVGHAMQRNKLIYALADAALIVSSDYEKGGTWAGAVEQLDNLRFTPIYVRSNGKSEKGLESLHERGAHRWPDSMTPESLVDILTASTPAENRAFVQGCLSFDDVSHKPEGRTADDQSEPSLSETKHPRRTVTPNSQLAEELFAKVRELLARMDVAMTEAEVAEQLGVSKSQTREWLRRLVDEGVLEQISKPTRYRSALLSQPLFNERR